MSRELLRREGKQAMLEATPAESEQMSVETLPSEKWKHFERDIERRSLRINK